MLFLTDCKTHRNCAEGKRGATFLNILPVCGEQKLEVFLGKCILFLSLQSCSVTILSAANKNGLDCINHMV